MALSIATIRALIEEGKTDAEIAEFAAECEADDADHEAMYGRPNTDADYGVSKWSCDETYARNDAGEYVNLM